MSAYQDKAPVGATHKFSEPTTSPWRDLSGPTWKWWSDTDGWKDSHSSTASLIKRQGHRLTAIVHPAWSGEGLPPVGLTVETVCGGCVRTVEILCITDRHVFMREPARNTEWLWDRENPGSRTFRPIKTPEQIAAEERLAAINYMEIDAGMCATAFDGDPEARVWIENLIDKGWRKQVAP